MYKIECSKDNESEYVKNFVCKLNHYENGSHGFTAYADLIIPVQYAAFPNVSTHRTSNSVLFNMSFEYCSSQKNIPPFLSQMFEIFKKHSNNLIHKCPYIPEKRIGLEELSFDSGLTFLSLLNFRFGDYEHIYTAKDRNVKLIFYVCNYVWIGIKRKNKSG